MSHLTRAPRSGIGSQASAVMSRAETACTRDLLTEANA